MPTQGTLAGKVNKAHSSNLLKVSGFVTAALTAFPGRFCGPRQTAQKHTGVLFVGNLLLSFSILEKTFFFIC